MANINASSQKKTLVLPSMSRHMNMSEEQARETWGKLEAAIAKIHEQNASTLSFEELYRYAYNMVLHRHAPMLYTGMEESLRKHLRSVIGELDKRQDMSFVRQVLEKWKAYHKSTQLIRDILMYMDKTFVKNHKRVPAYQRGMEIWTEEMIETPIGELLRTLVLDQVAAERSGETIDRGVLAAFTKMMTELGKLVYINELEKPFLAASHAYFEGQVVKDLADLDCPAYFQSVHKRLAAEQERVEHFLEPQSTRPKLLASLIDVFVTKQLAAVLNMEQSGFVCLLDNDNVPELALIYNIVARIPHNGTKSIKTLMAEHVKAVGKKMVAESEANKDAVAFTQKVLDLRDKYVRIIREAFAADRVFTQALNASFESFLNAFPRSPEYISLYIDAKLKKSLSVASDAQADAALDKVLQIFRYLNDKDMFEHFYKQHLSKRLLSGKVTNDHVEHIMLSKLKTECGYQFTSKLESMFADMKTSADTMASFRQHVQEQNVALPADISVQVLTTGSWPAKASEKCSLPLELEQSFAAFADFYRAKHSGRKLNWHSQMGMADVGVDIQGKRHTITVTTHQMCVLMVLNQTERPSFAQLQQATRIEKEDLKPALIGMTMVKGKMLLKKSPAGKEISESDVFFFNDKFKSPHLKIRFAAAGAQKEAEVASGVRQKVEEDRKHIIEAAIVRIMKARRVLDYTSILTEVSRHMSGRFVPDATDIKKRLESLIEREFLERDGNDRTLYRYIT